MDPQQCKVLEELMVLFSTFYPPTSEVMSRVLGRLLENLPEPQQPYPMALDDIPNRLLQFLEQHGTYPLLQHQVF